MSPYKVVLLSLCMLVNIQLVACKKNNADAEHIPFVMVSQPNNAAQTLKSYAGDVQAKQQTALSFRVGGQIIERYVDVGDHVKVGQVLARLDVKDAELQLQAAQAQLKSAQSNAQIAQDEVKRFQQLLPINAVSRSQYDNVLNQAESAEAALQQAESNYETASNQTRYNQLIAQKSGVITSRAAEVGQVVAEGQAIFQLAIADEREVVIGVPEQAISEMQVGQNAWVSLWSQPEQKIQARVREISPAADLSRTFQVKLSLANTQQSIPLGQSARVFFVENNHVLHVPLASVSAVEGQPYVWVVNADQSLRKVNVVLGAYGRETVAVLSGLSPNDYVVIGGVHLLREKQKIKPIDKDNRAVTLKQGVA